MPLSQKVASFALSTASGTQSIINTGFQPKALVLWTVGLTADGTGSKAMQSLAFAVSSSQRECLAFAVDDPSFGNSNTGADWSQRAVTELTDGTPTLGGIADLVSLDVGGFTLNTSIAFSSALKANYWAIGGSSITNAAVGTWTVSASGTRSKTGIGFQPDLVLFFGSDARTARGSYTPAMFAIGGFTNAGGTIQQGTQSLSFADNANSNTNTRLYQRVDQAIATETGGTKRLEATGVSMDSDGWTLNVTTLTTANTILGYLAIKGGNWKFGSLTTPTASGDASTTGLGFTPTGLMGFLGGRAASSALQSNIPLAYGFGAASAAAEARAVSLGVNANANIAKQGSANAKLISTINNALVVDIDAALKTFDSGGFTLTYNTVQGTGREFIWLAGGDPSSPPANVTPPNVGGNLYSGGTLTTTTGTWTNSPTSYTYQWQRDAAGDLNFVNIASATSSSYTLVGADEDCHVRCVVTAVNGGGSTPANSNSVGTIGPGYTEPVTNARVEPCANATVETFTAGANVPVNVVAPVVSGNKWWGSVLTTTTGSYSFSPTSFSYAWQKANDSGFTVGASTIGSNASIYTSVIGDVGSYVRSRVTASNADGASLIPANSNAFGLLSPSYIEPVTNARVDVVASNIPETYVDPAASSANPGGGAVAALVMLQMLRKTQGIVRRAE